MSSNSLLFSFFALFPLMETDKLTLYAGPSLGMAMGKIQSMDDFNFTEKSPFTATDVTIEEKTYIDDDFTELLFGGMLSLDYKMNNNIFLVFDLRVWYVNPKSVSLGKRANLLSIAPVVGVQFNF
jgi:hypothetical protein